MFVLVLAYLTLFACAQSFGGQARVLGRPPEWHLRERGCLCLCAEPEGSAFAVVSRIPFALAMRERKSDSREEREVTDPAHFRADAEMCGA